MGTILFVIGAAGCSGPPADSAAPAPADTGHGCPLEELGYGSDDGSADPTTEEDPGGSDGGADDDWTGEYFLPTRWQSYWILAVDGDGALTGWSQGGAINDSVVFFELIDPETWSGDLLDDETSCLAFVSMAGAEPVSADYLVERALLAGWKLPEGAAVATTDLCDGLDPERFPEGAAGWVGDYTWGFSLGRFEDGGEAFQAAVEADYRGSEGYLLAGYTHRVSLATGASEYAETAVAVAREQDAAGGLTGGYVSTVDLQDLPPAAYEGRPFAQAELP